VVTWVESEKFALCDGPFVIAPVTISVDVPPGILDAP